MWFNFFSEIPQAYRVNLYNILTVIVQVTIIVDKSMDSAKPIYKYLLKQNSQVVDLITYGRALNKLSREIKPVINQYIGDEWELGKFSEKEVTLLINSAELASRLRFQSANLLSEIRTLEFFKVLNKINIKVRPEIIDKDKVKATENRSVLTPSRTGKQQLKSLAGNIDDPTLKASLQRLANRLYRED